MSLYEKYVLPKFLNCACGSKPVARQREKVVPLAEGRVLEIGIGSGLNLPFYDKTKVDEIWGLDPSEELSEMARAVAITRRAWRLTSYLLAQKRFLCQMIILILF
jgi:protein-L-isoaspartate O-methyltransferase